MSEPTILCVDDEENILRTLKRLFMDEGWELLTANSGELGLELLKNHDVNLIIADYRMPEMTGVEFLKKAKEINPDAIRIILSGFADVEAIYQAINEGEVYKFISKPWNDEELIVAVKRSLEQYELVQENRTLYEKISSQNEELQTLNESLEAKVRQRTAALELRNQALSLAQDMLEQLPIGIMGISIDEEVVLVNSEMISIFGLGGRPVLGLKTEECLSEAVQDLIKNTLEVRSGQVFSGCTQKGHLLNLETCVIKGLDGPKGVMLIAQRQERILDGESKEISGGGGEQSQGRQEFQQEKL